MFSVVPGVVWVLVVGAWLWFWWSVNSLRSVGLCSFGCFD